MSAPPDWVGVYGGGRMGLGIATAFALAGIGVRLVDSKPRASDPFQTLVSEGNAQIARDLAFLQSRNAISETERGAIERLVAWYPAERIDVLADARFVFEAVPEIMDVKAEAFRTLGAQVPESCVLASTTSTFLVSDLAECVKNPARFANAHWLNPAHLMPLVEVSSGDQTSNATTDRLVALLEQAGKVPVRMGPTPGYVVPRIQALAMNEAARMVEEGVGTPEEIDKAIRVGFGLRFAVLGLLEFIDWGGGDILYYASTYLSETVDADRYRVPDVIADNMQQRRNGLKDARGFYDYADTDVDAYRDQRTAVFVSLLEHLGLLPQAGGARSLLKERGDIG